MNIHYQVITVSSDILASYILIQQNAFEIAVCRMTVILCRPQLLTGIHLSADTE